MNRIDELQHGFKYIQRYRKNGKWVYVYADKNTHSSINDNLYRSNSMARQAGSDRYAKEDALARQRQAPGPGHNFDSAARGWANAERYYAGKSSTYRNYANATIEKNSVSNLAKQTLSNAKSAISKGASVIKNMLGGGVSVSFDSGKMSKKIK